MMSGQVPEDTQNDRVAAVDTKNTHPKTSILLRKKTKFANTSEEKNNI